MKRADADGNIELEEGRATVLDAERLLRHLFQSTEVNFGSSAVKSGLNPLSGISLRGPAQPVMPPATFLLNADLIAGGPAVSFVNLGIQKARQLNQLVQLQPAEYRRLVEEFKLELGGRPGDADFAWFTPETSHIDNDMVDRLLRRGAVTLEAGSSKPATRPAELRRLFRRLVDRRVSFMLSERFAPLDETGDRLLPLPPEADRPMRGSGGQRIGLT